MRGEWKSKPLGNATIFLNGLWKGEKPPYVTVGVIRNTNFAKDGSIDDSDIAWLDVEAKKFEKRKLKFGDIILEKSGGGPKQPVGRVALFEKGDGDYSFSNFTSAIRVNDPQELDFRFLHKFLFWKYASGVTETMQSHSTGIRNLNADAYKEIVVPLPALLEQQRIVTILDEAFAGMATATTNAEAAPGHHRPFDEPGFLHLRRLHGHRRAPHPKLRLRNQSRTIKRLNTKETPPMSNPKNRAPVARAAAALALLAVAAAAPQANAAVTRAPFQQMATLDCGGGFCSADFIDLPDNKALEIEKVWCQVHSNGTVWSGEIYYHHAIPSFIVPLDLLWQRTVGSTKVSTLAAEPSMRVPLGRQFVAAIRYLGSTASGNCSFTGEILIQS